VELAGRVCVVTGGASGIGKAICEAFAESGARGVVVADINSDGAEAVAGAIRDKGHAAVAASGDVSVQEDVDRFVATAADQFGPVDIFCANAGILVPGGFDVPDSEWDRIWKVNLHSHVCAARAVLPSMLARGEGYLVHTASAAGLLTQLGSAPYSVTKHAVVALAEWLSITHHDSGLRVSCLCPQGVWTGMTGAATRDSSVVADATAGRDGMLEPENVADVVVQAIRDERFLILPHPEVAEYEKRRAGDRERWLRGMRRVQAQINTLSSGGA
jgi:NAD(P)-dependent dehydrogenase (short-subunit alcohol dehydrogenase family)